MKTVVLVLVGLLAVVLPACRRNQNKDEPNGRIKTRIRLQLDDGRTIEKAISEENGTGVESVRQLFGDATGRFVLTVRLRRSNDEIVEDTEGRLEKGVLAGKVSSYLVLDSKRCLVSELTYTADVRQGPCVSYYPETQQCQAHGNFDAGKKHGEFVMFYQNGNAAAKVHYDHDELDGLCEVYDSGGRTVVSGVYRNGTRVGGTFLEDLASFILESIHNQPITVRIATVNEPDKPSEVVEKTINQKANP